MNTPLQQAKNNITYIMKECDKEGQLNEFLKELLGESEGIRGVAEIVKTPNGTFQEEKYGRQIKGVWVDQWSVRAIVTGKHFVTGKLRDWETGFPVTIS